jgi:ribosomal protein L31
MHQMDIRRQTQKKINPNISPDIDDPNFYCRTCKATYKTRSYYRNHLKYTHIMELKPLRGHPRFDHYMKEDDSKETSCIICKLIFGSRRGYLQHMARHTKAGYMKSSRSKINPDVIPDLDDPNGYCESCGTTLASIRGYKQHVRFYHNLCKYPRAIPNAAITPDTSDPKNAHCASCNHNYSNRNAYLLHLQNVHCMKIDLTSSYRPKADPKVKADIGDPNNYYCSCKRKYSCRNTYARHLRNIHGVILDNRNKIVSIL